MSDEILNDIIPSVQFDSPFDEDLLYKTALSPTEGGKEYRYQKWQVPKRTWKIIADARTPAESGALWRFYQRRKGAYDTFLFENPNDSPVLEAQGQYDVFATGDGANRYWYLGRHSMSIPTGECLVVTGTLSVQRSIGGTGDWAAFSSYTGDLSYGAIVAVINSGDVLRADYRFRYRARFMNDKLSRRAFAYKLYASELELIQVV